MNMDKIMNTLIKNCPENILTPESQKVNKLSTTGGGIVLQFSNKNNLKLNINT